PIGSRPSRDDLLWPERRLQEDIGRLVRYRGREPAHDACKADRSRIVGYDDRVGSELHFPLVEQREPFTGLGKPGADGSGKAVEIVRMQWLAEFEHHVVRNVDHGM